MGTWCKQRNEHAPEKDAYETEIYELLDREFKTTIMMMFMS